MIAQHGITLGGLPLVAAGKPVTHSLGFTTEVSADGTNWGNPEDVVAQVISALADGDIVSRTRTGNRQAAIYVRIKAATGNILALGEKMLAAVVGKPVELLWQPPDSLGAPTVFDVMHSSMDFTFDDRAELRRERAYVVSLTALPWGRAASKVITAAVTPASPTVLDSGSATTNWTTTFPAGATRAVVSGAITATYDPDVTVGGPYGTILRRTATFATTTNKFIAVDWKSSLPSIQAFRVNGGANLPEARREPAPAATFTRSWYRVPDSVTSVTLFDFGIVHPANVAASATLSIDQVLTANALPAVGTTRQLTQTITPGGSVPAEGDVLVQHASAGLGQTIVYSHEAGGGYSPPLSQWRTASNLPTADATTVSGNRISLVTTPAWFDIPVAALPVGDAQLWARVRLATGSAAQVGIDYGVRSLMGSTELDSQIITTKFNLPAAGTWVMVPLARTVLPPRNLGPNGKVRIYLLRSTVHDIELDEAWLFAMDKGRLTVVDCGTGTPAAGTVHNRLRVTAPSLNAPFGRIEVATADDWSDSFVPDASKVLCDQTGHQFHQDGASIFTVTTGTTGASVSLEHYPRWHSNAGTV